jgi:solute:Na+ symporter, SSS family
VFHDRALLIGWLVGMVLGTAMAVSQQFSSVYPLHVGGSILPAYAALYAFVANLMVAIVLTPILDAVRLPRRPDATVEAEYEEQPRQLLPSG